MKLGAWIAFERDRRGYSQEDFARKVGLSPQGLSDIETGVTVMPRPTTRRRIAGAFNMEPETMLQVAANTPESNRKENAPTDNKPSIDEALSAVASYWLAGELTIDEITDRLYLEKKQEEEDKKKKEK